MMNPVEINITTKKLSIETLLTYQFSNELPDCSIIESVLCNIPIGSMVIYGHDLSVIDGNCRLSTIYQFINGNFALTNMLYLPQLDGIFYDELPQGLKRKIIQTMVDCIWISHCQTIILNDLISRYKK